MSFVHKISISLKEASHWLRQHPLAVIVHCGNTIIGLLQLVVIFISLHPQYCADISALEQMMGTGTQILTGLFGVTMTGYVFFLGRIDAIVQADHTVEDVANMLKKQFNHMVWAISASFLLALLGCGLCAYLKSYAVQVPDYLPLLLCNESLLLIGTGIVFILYYIASVVDSGNFCRAADSLRKKIEPGKVKGGDSALFFAQFSTLETQCKAFLPTAMQGSPLGKEQLNFLAKQGVLLPEMLQTANTLRQYHSCVLHGSGSFVSQKACEDITALVNDLAIQEPLTSLEKKSVNKDKQEKCRKRKK